MLFFWCSFRLVVDLACPGLRWSCGYDLFRSRLGILVVLRRARSWCNRNSTYRWVDRKVAQGGSLELDRNGFVCRSRAFHLRSNWTRNRSPWCRSYWAPSRVYSRASNHNGWSSTTPKSIELGGVVYQTFWLGPRRLHWNCFNAGTHTN